MSENVDDLLSDEDLPDILENNNESGPEETEIHKGAIVWAEFRKIYWPALVRSVNKRNRKACVWYLDSPKKCFKLPFKKILSFHDKKINDKIKEEAKNSPMKEHHDKVLNRTLTYLHRKSLGINDNPADYFDFEKPYFALCLSSESMSSDKNDKTATVRNTEESDDDDDNDDDEDSAESIPDDEMITDFRNSLCETDDSIEDEMLDAKKSPLALLAQTCSNIGADNPNNKPIISGLEKSKDNNNDSKKDKSPVIISDDHSNSKPSFKPYESVIKKDENLNSDFCGKKTPNSKSSSPSVHRGSPAASTGSCGKNSPTASENGRSSSHNPSKSESVVVSSLASPHTSNSSSTTLCSSQNTLSGLGYGSSAGLGLDLARSDAKEGLSHLGLSAYKALNGLNPLSNCTGCGPVPGHPIDTHAYQAAAQSGLLKAGSYPLGAAALSPYVGYARVKTASGGTTLVPVCRDPYCTNCQFSMHNAQLSSCPSGCTQCTHDRLSTSLPGLGHMPGLTGSAAAMAAVAAAGGMPGLSYPHSVLARPNVCSWMIGDTYCGKRFSTSEELLQHLRTHTNLSTSESPLSLISPAFSLASSSLNAACHMHYSSGASLTSPAGLRRTYPTSLSPVSSLSAASRYHPYKPTLSSLQGSPLSQLGHPGLGMYYPYNLYGQRLGPPVHP